MSGVLGSVFLLTLKRSLVCILHKQECQPWEPDGWSTSTWHGNDQWQAWLWSSHCNIALSPSASCGLRCLWDIKFRQNVFAHNTMTTPWEIKTRHKGTKAPTTERYECKRLTLILNVPRQIVNSTLCSSSKFGGRRATSSYVGQHDERQDIFTVTLKCVCKACGRLWIMLFETVCFNVILGRQLWRQENPSACSLDSELHAPRTLQWEY